MTLADPTLAAEPSSIRHGLRTFTASLHARVDDHMSELLRQPEGYAKFLMASAAGVLPLERALCAAGISAVVPDWPARTRSAALRADLASLSLPASETDYPGRDVELGGEAHLFGALYVLEGSRLGARAILHALGNSPSAVHHCACRYLSHGAGQPLWQTFLSQLEASAEVRRNHEATFEGASSAFAAFLPRDGA